MPIALGLAGDPKRVYAHVFLQIFERGRVSLAAALYVLGLCSSESKMAYKSRPMKLERALIIVNRNTTF